MSRVDDEARIRERRDGREMAGEGKGGLVHPPPS